MSWKLIPSKTDFSVDADGACGYSGGKSDYNVDLCATASENDKKPVIMGRFKLLMALQPHKALHKLG